MVELTFSHFWFSNSSNVIYIPVATLNSKFNNLLLFTNYKTLPIYEVFISTDDLDKSKYIALNDNTVFAS